jgi:F0F1-type ATP synthase epsilon subunit
MLRSKLPADGHPSEKDPEVADNTITCRLVTPSQELLNEQVVYASVPAWDGLIGFQHGGSPLVSRLGLGKLRLDFPVDSGSGSREYYVEDGFLEMGHNELIILLSAPSRLRSSSSQTPRRNWPRQRPAWCPRMPPTSSKPLHRSPVPRSVPA